MKILITEEQKKNLFVPRNLENRDEQYKQQIKKEITKFLTDEDIGEINFEYKDGELPFMVEMDDIRHTLRKYGEFLDANGNNIELSFLIDVSRYSNTISELLNFSIKKDNSVENWDDMMISEIRANIVSTVAETTIKGKYILYNEEKMLKGYIKNIDITI